MTSSLKAKYHILAILTVAVWGTTFISTKILINNGLSPQEIFLLRFIIAYIGIWFISPRKIFSDSIKDELTMFAAGLTGGTLYFLTENTALKFTQTTNVAFIICATPLLTTGLSLLTDRNKKVSHKIRMIKWLAFFSKIRIHYFHISQLDIDDPSIYHN